MLLENHVDQLAGDLPLQFRGPFARGLLRGTRASGPCFFFHRPGLHPSHQSLFDK